MNKCAFSLRDTKYIWLFTEGGWVDGLRKKFNSLQPKTIKKKQIDSSGNMVEMDVIETNNSTNRLDVIGSSPFKASAAALALFFNNGSKAVSNIAPSVIDELESSFAKKFELQKRVAERDAEAEKSSFGFKEYILGSDKANFKLTKCSQPYSDKRYTDCVTDIKTTIAGLPAKINVLGFYDNKLWFINIEVPVKSLSDVGAINSGISANFNRELENIGGGAIGFDVGKNAVHSLFIDMNIKANIKASVTIRYFNKETLSQLEHIAASDEESARNSKLKQRAKDM